MPLELTDIADVIVEAIKAEVEPLRVELAATKERAALEIAALRSELAMVKAATPDAFRLRSIVVDMASEEVSKLMPSHVSVSAVDREELSRLIAEQVSGLPVPADGTSVTVDDVAPLISSEMQKAMAVVRAELITLHESEITSQINAAVAKYLSEWPKPEDGKSLTPDDMAPLIAAEVQKAISAIPQPKDGAGILGAFIDRDGHLLVTLSDGSTKDVGSVVGNDGRDVNSEDVEKAVAEAVAKIPLPKDGLNGKDGFGFDDLSVEYDGKRSVTLKFVRGDDVKVFLLTLPIPVYEGLYKPGQAYERGSIVTWAGSAWHANSDTKAEPGTAAAASRAWAQMVRKGDAGKSGQKGDPGDRGPMGPEGPRGPQGY